MLQLRNIRKRYQTGELVQQALDGVSLSLRDSEFVSILGPSGSGKTTLLNIIGGLDRYDSGDLLINEVSTKAYNDRDWDGYRNHSIGFVFQSYNLIPHQTILSNVELALTIGGASRAQRRARARTALEQVGLGRQLHKRPNQLSGGQMQRVAIARALVNDPDILLADEPTGALDSETSLQIMALLRQVAEDRLVVMVTHNPELAEQYSTRIVRLKDGRIVDDSNPFSPTAEAAAHTTPGRKAGMSLLTSLSLSFHNLRTKKGRTLLTAFAGSIGIIGIALILSMSTGANQYIRQVEEESLQNYPLQITETSLDLSAYRPDSADTEEADDRVREWRTVTNLFSRVNSNDLRALRSYLEGDGAEVYRHTQAIEYEYGVTPLIYALRGETVRQVNPDRSFAALGFSGGEGIGGLFSAFSSTDVFHAMPAAEALYRGQYAVLAGKWPEDWHDCVLVLTGRGRVSDLALYAMGLKDPQRLDEMIKAFAEGETATEEEEQEYRYEDFLGAEFRLVNSADLYRYDDAYGVWTDRSDDEATVRRLAEQGEVLRIVGVVRPVQDSSSPVLSAGINYLPSLTMHLMETAAKSPAVLAQLADPDTDILTGRAFGEEPAQSVPDLQNLFTVDQEALEKAFRFDRDGMDLDLSDLDLSGMDFDLPDLASSIDPSALSLSLPSLGEDQVRQLLGGLSVNISREELEKLFGGLVEGYLAIAAEDPSTDYAKLPQALQGYLASEEAQALLAGAIRQALEQAGEDLVTPEQLGELIAGVMAGYPAYLLENGLEADEDQPYAYLSDYLQSPAVQAALSDSAGELQARAASLLTTPERLAELSQALLAGYAPYAEKNRLPELSRLQESFTAYLAGDEAQALLAEGVSRAVDATELERRAAQMFSDYSAALSGQLGSLLGGVVDQLSNAVAEGLAANLDSLMQQMSENFANAFRFDPDALAGAFTATMDGAQLRDLMNSLLSREENSLDGNLKKLGYADNAKPSSISIYPRDFAGKAAVKQLLDEYNETMRQSGQEEKVIVYTDLVDALMSSVTDIIDAISYVLIAFVAVSLIVSCIMIGIITHISVLERTKEIGILRALGASKRNISQVFNAETFLIGLCAGLLGVGISALLTIPINALLRGLIEGAAPRAVLPLGPAAVLVLLSMGITMLGGLLPAKNAAKKDPVIALRTE